MDRKPLLRQLNGAFSFWAALTAPQGWTATDRTIRPRCGPTRSGRRERRDVGPVEQELKMADDALPDHLSNDPRSPHYNEAVLQRDVGIRFNGKEKTNVEEYCVSEGWIRVAAGKAVDRYGNPLTIKLTGKVEPYFRDNKE
jgi:hypothetical protein